MSEELTRAVETLPGVRRAVLEGPPWTLYVIYDPAKVTWGELSRPLADHLASANLPSGEVEIVPATVPTRQPRRRVRLVDAGVRSSGARESDARVVLEWEGRDFVGEDTGESGSAAELRLAARATLGALEQVVEGQVGFRLLGVKAHQAFDSELVVTSVSTGRGPPLVGVAIVHGSPVEAAAMAVLHATNRMLGNFIWTG
jgi:hypothetical protein